MIGNDNRIPYSLNSTRIVQVNAIVKGQTKLLVILCDKRIWIISILSSTLFVIRSAVHSTTQHTPSQLVFDRGAILIINYEAS